MAEALQYVVRLLHIISGVFWVGGALFFLGVNRRLQKVPPPVGPGGLLVMGEFATKALPGAGFATVVFGIWNQYLIAGTLDYRASAWNVLLGAALALALVALAVSLVVTEPTFKKLKALAEKMPRSAPGTPPGPPPPEMKALGRRLVLGGLSATAMTFTALVLMVVATLTRVG